jgi:hypothetical protein
MSASSFLNLVVDSSLLFSASLWVSAFFDINNYMSHSYSSASVVFATCGMSSMWLL